MVPASLFDSASPIGLGETVADPDVTARPEGSRQLRTLLEEILDRRLSVGRVRRRISVDLP
jgi:hypothetical protein